VAPPCEWKRKNGVFACFGAFFANFATMKNRFSKNLSARLILPVDATFVSNLTFLGLLSPDISLGEKNNHHPCTHPDNTQLISPSVNLGDPH